MRNSKLALIGSGLFILCIGFVAGRSTSGLGYSKIMQPTTPLDTGMLLHEAISSDDLYSFKSLWSPYKQNTVTQAQLDELHKHMDVDNAEFVTKEIITDKNGHEIIVRLSMLNPKQEQLIDAIQVVK